MLGEVASAVARDGCTDKSLQEAARVDRPHAERNVHRLFNRYGLALRVPISHLEVPGTATEEALSIPFLRIPDYLRLLLAKYEQVLLGGLPVGPESEQLCTTFWQRFRCYQPDHEIFTKRTEEERRKCVPIMLHGDKGRTLQKSPIFVMSLETPWGLPPHLLQRCSFDNKCSERKQFRDGRLSFTCEQQARESRKRGHEDMSKCTMGAPRERLDHESDPTGCHQRHSSKGHSYLSRFLIAAVTSKTYKKNERALPSLLKEVAAELRDLFENGLETSSSKLFFVFIAVKGDAEFHWDAAQFNRSYYNTGVVNDLPMCPLCLAGAPDYSFTDVADQPNWATTLGKSDPWDFLPPLNEAPYACGFPASLYKFDPFHVLKFGVFRDCVGSCIVRLASLRYFDYDDGDSKGIQARLTRAFSLYKMWCLASAKNPTLKSFSKANFNYEKKRSFAWVNGKGSEITLLMMFLDFFLQQALAKPLKQDGDKLLLNVMLQTIRGGLNYVGIMHAHGLWLPRCCGETQINAGFAFLRGYAWLADYCTQRGLSGFRLRPKLHYFHHLLYESQEQLKSGSGFLLSSVMWLCESNEDFIGRLSRVSRRVSARTAGLRTTQRYLVKVRALLERLALK